MLGFLAWYVNATGPIMFVKHISADKTNCDLCILLRKLDRDSGAAFYPTGTILESSLEELRPDQSKIDLRLFVLPKNRQILIILYTVNRPYDGLNSRET